MENLELFIGLAVALLLALMDAYILFVVSETFGD